MKIVINEGDRSYALSKEVMTLYREAAGRPNVHYVDICRNDPKLIEIIESIGLERASPNSEVVLRIIEVPDHVYWRVLHEGDGQESLHVQDPDTPSREEQRAAALQEIIDYFSDSNNKENADYGDKIAEALITLAKEVRQKEDTEDFSPYNIIS